MSILMMVSPGSARIDLLLDGLPAGEAGETGCPQPMAARAQLAGGYGCGPAAIQLEVVTG